MAKTRPTDITYSTEAIAYLSDTGTFEDDLSARSVWETTVDAATTIGSTGTAASYSLNLSVDDLETYTENTGGNPIQFTANGTSQPESHKMELAQEYVALIGPLSHEPDYGGNTRLTATDLGTLTTSFLAFDDWISSSTVGDGDNNDWYEFSISSTSDVTLNFRNFSGTGNFPDADFSIEDVNNVLIHLSYSYDVTENVILSQLSPGTYYIHVFPGEDATHYEIKVKADPVAGDTIAPTNPGAPDLASNDDLGRWNNDDLTSKSSGLTFSWASSTDSGGSGLSGYQWKLDNGSLNFTTSTQIDISAAEGQHVLYVRAIDNANNTSNYSTISFTVDLTAPTVALTSPPDGAITSDLTPLLQWDASSDAYKFDLQYETAALFDEVTVTDIASEQYQIAGPLDVNKTYYWRIKAYDDAGNVSGWVGDSVFLTDDAGNTLATARGLGTLAPASYSYSGWVGSLDTDDYYGFTLDGTTDLHLTLTGLSANADLRLLDSSGSTIASSTSGGATPEVIDYQVGAGDYYIRVNQNSGDTDYTLGIEPTPVVPPDFAGNTLATARGLGTLAPASYAYSDWVGSLDTDDYYSFTLDGTTDLHLTLSGLSANADLRLLDSSGSLIASSTSGGSTTEVIDYQVGAGDYYIRVNQNSGDTDYTLGIEPTPVVPPDFAGNTLATARGLGTLAPASYAYSDWVGSLDTDDYYGFTLDGTTDLHLTLSGLSANADLRLLDSSGSLIASSTSGGAAPEVIDYQVGAGDYYIRVNQNSGDTDYTLGIEPTPVDDYTGDSSTTGLVTEGSWTNGSLETGTDTDWFRVTLDASRVYTFGVEETEVGLFEIDPQIRLFTSVGTELAVAQTDYAGNAAIHGVTGLSGTYYLEVSDAGVLFETGTYRLKMSSVAASRILPDKLSDPDAIGDMAFLSTTAYSANIPSGKTLESYLDSSGWDLLDDQFLDEPDSAFDPIIDWPDYFADGNDIGYYDHGGAQAFVAKKGDTLAIAFRGTEFISIEVAQDILGNLHQSDFYENYEQLIDAVELYVEQNSISKIYVTGHSLGGSMAEAFAVLDGWRFDEPVSIVDFGSPGIDPSEFGPKTSLSEQILHVTHTGDLVPHLFTTIPVIGNWRLDGREIEISIPTVLNPLTEHKSLIYQANIEAIVSSPLIGQVSDLTELVVGKSSIDAGSVDSNFADNIDQSGHSEQNLVLGLAGNDTLIGGSNDDILDGGTETDILLGGDGNDELIGGDDIDVLLGLADNDTLFGGDGMDYLVGGLGEDILSGGPGVDVLTGNANFSTTLDGVTDTMDYDALDLTDIDYLFGFDTSDPAAGGDIIDLEDLFAGLPDAYPGYEGGTTVVNTDIAPGHAVVIAAFLDSGVVNVDPIALVVGITEAAELTDNIIM